MSGIRHMMGFMGGFVPASLPNLQWHIKASDGVTTLEDNDLIDSWHDLSDNHYNLLAETGSGHTRATYLPTGFNGSPCVDFTTSDFTFPSALGARFSKVNAFTFCGKFVIDSVAAATQGIFTVSIANDDRFQISITGNTNLNIAYFNGATWVGHQVPGITVGTHYFTFVQQVGVIDPILYLDDQLIVTPGFTSNGSISANGIYVLGSVRGTTTTSQFDGKIVEMFLYNDVKTQFDQLNNYLLNAA